VDSLSTVALTRALVDIDSTTGREGEAGRWLAGELRRRGYRVTEQPVDASRFNIVATRTAPVVVFSTHFDCVPPFFPSREEGGRIYGRGSCDAKGILAAQVAAADALHAHGDDRVGLLFVVGEERGSDGARLANTRPAGARFLINGEPTDNRLGLATRGSYRVKLRAAGRAAHSSFPELGESAIEKLIEALGILRKLDLPDDHLLGRTHYTVGLIAGGVAPNVIPPSAEAEVLFRTVTPGRIIRDLLSRLDGLVTVEEMVDVPPVTMESVPGFDTAVFPYTTDIPYLSAWGRPLLFGPGSIHVAHTDHEFIEIAELHAAVEAYVGLAKGLLTRAA
jgi:acetylornithine deacetylase